MHVMSISHRRRDATVLSSRVGRCELGLSKGPFSAKRNARNARRITRNAITCVACDTRIARIASKQLALNYTQAFCLRCARCVRCVRLEIAKFHYKDPTRTRHGPDRTRTDFFCGTLGPCGSGRVRVVEFSSYSTTCADFVRVGSV